jgi:hypothetical protein
VREGILSIQVPPNQSEYTVRNDIVLQLQKLFSHLKYSEQRAYSPDDWVYAYKDEAGILPVNVSQQQDAQEFFQVLCERLERSHENYSSEAQTKNNYDGNTVSDLLKSSFGGKTCHHMLRGRLKKFSNPNPNPHQSIIRSTVNLALNPNLNTYPNPNPNPNFR